MMKKFIPIFLILLLFPYTLISCGNDKNNSPTNEAPIAEENFGEKVHDPNLNTMTNDEINDDLSKIFNGLNLYLNENSDKEKLMIGQIHNGYGTLYQDLVFTQLNNVKGENSGSIHLNPVKETNDHHILYMIGFDYYEDQNPTLPLQFEELFKLTFPSDVTTKNLSEYLKEVDSSPKKFPLKNSEVVIAKNVKNGKTKITIGYKLLINIE